LSSIKKKTKGNSSNEEGEGKQWRRFPELLGPAVEWLGEGNREWLCKRG
jgi:hypothetical protein